MIYSLPFQQTARYVSEHESEITEAEIEDISRVLEYSNLKDVYNPILSDKVLEQYKRDSNKEDIIAYFGTWIKQGIKHPETYISATMNQNYALFDPLVPSYWMPVNSISEYSQQRESNKLINESLNIHDVKELLPFKDNIRAYYTFCYHLPILNVLSNTGIYAILLIVLTLKALLKKNIRWLVISIPLLLSTLVVIFAPAIKGNPRYFLPVIYSFYVWVAYYIKTDKVLDSGGNQ